MPAVLTRGFTFSTNATVTNVKLHNLVDNATIASIDQTNLDNSTSSLVTISATAPVSPFTGQLWYDTTAGILKYYNGTAFVAVAKGSAFTNKSGGSLAAGDVVIVDTTTDQSVTTTTTANNQLVAGVVLDPTIANNASGTILTEGIAPALTVTGSTTRGQFLSTGTTVKKATPSSSPNLGTFAIALSASSTSVIAWLHSPSGLSGTANTQAALDGATSPSATNVFLTSTDQTNAFDPRQKIYVGDDFIATNDKISGAASTKDIICAHTYYTSTTGSGSVLFDEYDGQSGVVSLKGSGQAVIMNLEDKGSDNFNKPFLATKTNFSFKTRFTSIAGTGEAFVGLADGSPSQIASQNNGLFFRITSTTSNITAYSIQGGSQSTLNTGVAMAVGTFHDCEARRTGSNTYDIYVDGVNKGTITATVPTANLGLLMAINAIDIAVDYWQVSYSR